MRGTSYGGNLGAPLYGDPMDDSVDLTDVEQIVVAVIGEQTTPDRSADTERVSEATVARLRERGGSFSLHTTPPWFGLAPEYRRLEDLGLVEIDPGMAPFVAPGEPAPTMDRLYLRLTDAGRAAVGGLPSEWHSRAEDMDASLLVGNVAVRCHVGSECLVVDGDVWSDELR